MLPIVVILVLIIIGHIIKRREVNDYTGRINFTVEYYKNFVRLVNSKTGRHFDNIIYFWLMERVERMQLELGITGLIDYIDRLAGIQARNHPFLINFLSEIKTFDTFDNYFMIQRFQQSAEVCANMLIRHKGNLEEKINKAQKSLFNPFACFSEGIKYILFLPITILYWCGLITGNLLNKIRFSFFIKILNYIFILIGLVGSLITIMLGWNEAMCMIKNLLKL